MGRELRMVPKDWEHPKNSQGHLQPMHYKAYGPEAEEWVSNCVLWSQGRHPDQLDPDSSGKKYQFYWEWSGEPPDPEYYMPDFPEAERTHFQLYETTTEGTPVSPIFNTLDALCLWAEDNATTFASFKATKEEWKGMFEKGLVSHTEGNMMFI